MDLGLCVVFMKSLSMPSPRVHTIEITHEDIERGKRWEPCLCPIALASQRVWPESVNIIVGPDRGIQLTINGTDWVEYPLPDTAKLWLADFDAGKFVHPLVFKVTDPC